MKKIISTFLLATFPLTTLATTPDFDSDLHVKISPDLEVQSGQEFTIEVLETYDDLERCEDFYYDWRQVSGPLGISPLNTDVLAPKFQIFTAGEYVFSLSIKETCQEKEIISKPDEIKIIVLEPEVDPAAGQWNLAIAPLKTTLPSDGMTKQDFNFFIKHTYDGQVDYPDGEKIEILLKSENEILKKNLGKYTLKSPTTKDGKIGIRYTSPLITDDFEGGDITMQIATVHGTTESTLYIKPRDEIAQLNLTISQITDNPSYLIKDKPALGRVTLDWADNNTKTLTGEVRIFVDNEEIFNKTDTFHDSYTLEQLTEKENSVDFYFTPKSDEILIGAYFQNSDGSAKTEKSYKVKNIKPFTPQIFALKQAEYADLDVIDFSEDQNMRDKVEFAYSRLPFSTIETDLKHVQTITLEDITADMLIILPASATSKDLPNAFYPTDDVNILARKIYPRTDLPTSQGVLLTDTDFEIIFADSPTLFVDGGKGINQESVLDFATKYIINPIFTDLTDSHWAYVYIQDLISKNILTGYADDTIRPDKPVTRAEFLKMLLTAKDKEIPLAQGNTLFADVDITQWYAPYVELAFAENIVSGYNDDTFRPAQGITRAEAVKILVSEGNYELPAELNTTSFPDVDLTAWYAPAVSVAVEEKLIKGYTDGYFRPNKPITRAESSKIIDLLTD